MNWSARYANNQVSNAGSEEDALQILGYLKTCFGLLRGFTYLQKDTSQSMTSEWGESSIHMHRISILLLTRCSFSISTDTYDL